MMKVNTVEQYKILEYLEENFYTENLEIKLLDRNIVGITDQNGDRLIFKYVNGKVIWEDTIK